MVKIIERVVILYIFIILMSTFAPKPTSVVLGLVSRTVLRLTTLLQIHSIEVGMAIREGLQIYEYN